VSLLRDPDFYINCLIPDRTVGMLLKIENYRLFLVDANVSSNKETKRKKKAVETHTNRERQKYFADDDKYDLKTMFQREKLSTAEDQNGMLSRLTINHYNFKEVEVSIMMF
jgi:hypothetical protein